jgi:hypothetical protein
MNNHIKSLVNGDFEVVPLDDSAFIKSQKDREKALDELAKIGHQWEIAKLEYEKKNDEWWNNLSYEERCDAFYAVMKRFSHGELEKKGSYRYILYDVFGFGPDMYVSGMDCGFMALHNAIVTQEDNGDESI